MKVPARGGVNAAVNESPGAIGWNRRSPAPLQPGTPSGIALELDAMPVHRGRLGEPVHHRDARRPAALEHERRPGTGAESRRRLRVSLLHRVRHDVRRVGRCARLLDEQTEAFSARQPRPSAGAAAGAVAAACAGAPARGATSMPSTRPVIR